MQTTTVSHHEDLRKKVTVHPTLPKEGNEDGPRGRQISGSVGQFACHQTYVTPLPPFQRILWGGGGNNTLVPRVPNCTVAQPITTSVDSVQLIWEGMHGARGAG